MSTVSTVSAVYTRWYLHLWWYFDPPMLMSEPSWISHRKKSNMTQIHEVHTNWNGKPKGHLKRALLTALSVWVTGELLFPVGFSSFIKSKSFFGRFILSWFASKIVISLIIKAWLMFNMKITCWYFELRDTFGLLPSSQCDIRAGWNLKLTFFTWFFAMIFLTYLTALDKEQITWSLWARHGTLWTTSVCAGNPFLEGKAPHTWTGTGGTWFNLY